MLVSSPKEQNTGQEERASGSARESFNWMLGKMSSLKGWSSTETGCPGKFQHCWRYLDDAYMWHTGQGLVVDIAVVA